MTLTVEPTEGGTRVTLEHADLTAEQAVHHEQGWEHYFERLERLAATGDAGPDDWAWAPETLDPQVAAEAVLAAIQPVLRGLTVEDRTRPTPCTDFTCHDLVEHLAGSMATLGSMAGASIADPGGAPEPRVSAMAAAAVHAWRGVDVESTVPGPGGHELPASYAAAVLPLELLLHGWDLAQAADLELAVSDQVVAYVHELAETVVPSARSRGAFGDEVAAAPEAGPLDRLAAFAGRSSLVTA